MKIQHVSRRLRRFIRATKAVSALEYAILVGIITIGVAAALVTFSDNITTAIKGIGGKVAETGGTADNADLTPDPTP